MVIAFFKGTLHAVQTMMEAPELRKYVFYKFKEIKNKIIIQFIFLEDNQ